MNENSNTDGGKMNTNLVSNATLQAISHIQVFLVVTKKKLQNERGDIPGWVLVTVMTAGLVVAVWSVADSQLKTVLTDALRGVSQP
jgi:hypothetical protein